MLHVTGRSRIIGYMSSCERLQMLMMWRIYDSILLHQIMHTRDIIVLEHYLPIPLLSDVKITGIIWKII